MTWVRIQDEMPEHPKLKKAGPLGLALYVAGLCYCNRHLTDGFIPLGAAETLVCWKFWGRREEGRGHQVFTVDYGSGSMGENVNAEFAAKLLVDAGLWEPSDGGYIVHDYLDHQTSKEEVLLKREQVKSRVHRHRNSVGNADVTLARSTEVQKSESRREEESKPTTFVTADAATVERSTSQDDSKPNPRREWDDALDLLWEDYPRKVGKPAALRAWRAIHPQGQEAFDAIDAGLRKWLEYWNGKDREVICHPATWLNQRRWENEP